MYFGGHRNPPQCPKLSCNILWLFYLCISAIMFETSAEDCSCFWLKFIVCMTTCMLYCSHELPCGMRSFSVCHIVYLCSRNKNRQIKKDYKIVVFIHEILILITVIFNKVNMTEDVRGQLTKNCFSIMNRVSLTAIPHQN